jgi:lipopolysaccharide transport system ATP-binding protein
MDARWIAPPASSAPDRRLLNVRSVSKVFYIYERPIDRLLERLAGGRRHRRHQAVSGVSLDLAPGEALGIIGANGAGKSTLLKLVTGILLPDQGAVERDGVVTGLLELGAGFDEHLSGRENLRINARLLGLDLDQVYEREAAIVAFAELGDFIDAPVRTYSSGMTMRLGFAVAIHSQPACFVVDEALAVGDIRFQQKCLAAIQRYLQWGGALLFVSHDLNAVKRICQRALVLHRGCTVFQGAPHEAAKYYEHLMGDAFQAVAPSVRYGKQQVRMEKVRVLGGENGDESAALITGGLARIEIDLYSAIDSDSLALGFMIRDRLGQDLFGTNTELRRIALPMQAGQSYRLTFAFQVHLGPGAYTLTFGLHDRHNYLEDVQDWWNESVAFDVRSGADAAFVGVCYQPVMSVAFIQREPDVLNRTLERLP